jgi:hypothetical protein
MYEAFFANYVWFVRNTVDNSYAVDSRLHPVWFEHSYSAHVYAAWLNGEV